MINIIKYMSQNRLYNNTDLALLGVHLQTGIGGPSCSELYTLLRKILINVILA